MAIEKTKGFNLNAGDTILFREGEMGTIKEVGVDSDNSAMYVYVESLLFPLVIDWHDDVEVYRPTSLEGP